jgi:hypothetical protein
VGNGRVSPSMNRRSRGVGFSKNDRGPNFASGPSSCCSCRAQIEPSRV